MSYESYYKKIRDFYKRNRRMPSYKEIMDMLHFKSKNSVFKLVKKLMDDNIIAKDDSGRLIPNRIFGELRVLGTVEAGFPSPAEEELSDTMSLDEYLIKNKEATFMLKVRGDSMIDAGIMEGDMVLVERGVQANDGDIVVAEVDHAWTMKFLDKNGSKVRLVPGNKKYRPIYPEEELNIAAVVKAVIRKY
jgi:SOS regulatory protein LexA